VNADLEAVPRRTHIPWEMLKPHLQTIIDDRAREVGVGDGRWTWENMSSQGQHDWIRRETEVAAVVDTWTSSFDTDADTVEAFRALPPLETQLHPYSGEEETDRRHVSLTSASTITMRPVKWLWRDRMPLGELSLLAGREDIGKSTISYTLTAWITTGTMKGEYLGTPRAVLVAASEDSWEHTIVPRLMAAGADLDLVYRVDVVTSDGFDGSLDLPADLGQLESSAKAVGAVLLLLDPLMSRLSATLDSHKDAEVRRALEPLVGLAHRASMAVLGLIHVNKGSSTDALTSIMASRAFTAVARAVLFAVKDPEDESRRILGNVKNNLGRSDLPTFGYQIGGHQVGETDDGPVWTGKVEWTGRSDRSIRDILVDVNEGNREKMQPGDDPVGWLFDFLKSENGSKASASVKRAGKEAGFSSDILNRSAKRLGVEFVSEGFPRITIWNLPQSLQSPGESSTTTTTTTTESDQGLWETPVAAVDAVVAVVQAPREVATTGGDF
jgi:hypothetical protein